MQLLRMTAVKAATGHKADESIYGKVRVGMFTTPVKIGPRSVAWPDTEVHAINAARVAGKSDAEIRELVKALHAKRTEAFAGVTQ